MVAGGGHIIRHLVFKGQHTVHIHIPGAGDEVFLIGVFAGELETDEVAAVIQALAVHEIVLVLHPAGGLHLADALPFLRGHQVHADAGLCDSAAAQAVQVAVIFIGIGGVFVLGEGGLVPVDDGVGAGTVVVRDVGHIVAGRQHLPGQADDHGQGDDHQGFFPAELSAGALFLCHNASPFHFFDCHIIPAFALFRNRV